MYCGSGVGGLDRPAGSHVNTRWHSNGEKKEGRKMHTERSALKLHTHSQVIPSPGRVFSLN